MVKKKKWIIIAVVVIVAIIVFSIVVGVNKEKKDRPYNYDLDEYVKVGDYKGLPYARKKVKVSSDEVDTEIDRRLANASEVKTIKEGKVEDGDTINIAFKGTVDGKEFEGGSSESFDLTVGTTQMIDGFVDGLRGKKIGDKVSLDLQFPDDYQKKELAGKPVTFDININSKKVVKQPKLNKKFVQKNSDAETVDEYKKLVKKDLLAQKQDKADSELKAQMWGQIIKDSKAKKYPEKEMGEAETDVFYMENQYRQQAQSMGIEWKDFLKKYLNTDEEGFKKIKKDYAQDIVLQEMTMHSIARKEGIKLSKREYSNELDNILEQSGYTKETFKRDYGKTIEQMAAENKWKNGIFLDKVMDRVIELGEEVPQKEYDKILKKQEKQQ